MRYSGPSRRVARSALLLAVLALLAITIGFPLFASADSPPELRFDPFGSRPELAARERNTENRSPQFEPVLLSTIVRGERSLVNLGGTILALQEESQGYRLLEVRAFDALFRKDGQEIRLEVVRQGSDPS